MKNYRYITLVLLTLMTLAFGGLTAQAQGKKNILLIHEVRKEDARAVERGNIRQVPVIATVKLADEFVGKQKLRLTCNLITKNTDGTSTNITEQMVMPGDNLITLKLPMKKGVFAKDFVLLVKVFEERKQLGLAEKRGNF